MNQLLPLRQAAVIALALVPFANTLADSSDTTVDFGEAYFRLLAASGTIRATRLEAEAEKLQAEAAESLGGPSLNLTGAAVRGRTESNLDISGISSPTNQVIGRLALAVPALSSVSLPNTLGSNTVGNSTATYLGAAYPLYTGGKFQALQEMTNARAEESASAARETEGQTVTLLVKRYFSAQLSRRVVAVRSEATLGIAEHRRMALRFEQEGQIAKVDRLRADAALANARREEQKARSDAELADIALARLIDSAAKTKLSTPLFVGIDPIDPLEIFVDHALAHHPAFARIAGRRHQAEALHRLDKAQYAPDVVLVGGYQLSHSGIDTLNPVWGVGVVINIKLLDQVDRNRMLRASTLEEERADVARQQAMLDISTQVEMYWRAVESARQTYLSMTPSVELAVETARLAERGFSEGQATSLDVIDARLQLAKIRTERAQAAYDYDVALAQLLEASGDSDEFNRYARGANLNVEEIN